MSQFFRSGTSDRRVAVRPKATGRPLPPTELTLEQIRARREAQFEDEAESEGRAIRNVRRITPARERKFQYD